MHFNIVKVQSDTEFGTGIAISKQLVITAGHVIKDDHPVVITADNNSYVGQIHHKEEKIAIIKINDLCFMDGFDDSDNFLYFTDEEIWDGSTQWEVEGYITDQQCEWHIQGKGIYDNYEKYMYSDFKLGFIESGKSENFKGLSGSPVICHERIIGILQSDNEDVLGERELSFLSIRSFSSVIPSECIKECFYINELRKECCLLCSGEIDKNIKNHKYIPEIFVEENEYKDYLRFFAQPLLFINKIIDELKKLDFSYINSFLKKGGYKEINFEIYPDLVELNDLNNIVKNLQIDLNDSINMIDVLEMKAKNNMSAREEYYSSEYRHRDSMKWVLEEYLRQTKFIADYRILMLTKRAGQGKTNFVCDFTNNFLLKKQIPALFYNAHDFCEHPWEMIKKNITINHKYDLGYIEPVLAKRWNKIREPIMIIIDGLNENSTLNDFGTYVEATIKEIAKYPFLKLVMTTRNELLKERFSSLNSETLGNLFYRLDMPDRGPLFKERIIQGYFEHFDIKSRIMSLDAYEKLSNNPLLLRVFCETYKGNHNVYLHDIYAYALFNDYYEKKKEEVAKKKQGSGGILFDMIIKKVCEKMIELKSFSNIPEDIFELSEVEILDSIIEADIIFTEEHQAKKGYVNDFCKVISFTFDEFRDFCLTRYMISKDDAKTSFPVIWKEMNEEKWAITEGVGKFSFYLARSIRKDILPVLRSSKEYYDIYWENVWHLEDKDIDDKDVAIWKKQIETGGEYCSRIVAFLLLRKDRKYYRKTSIDLLYEIFDNLAFDAGIFDLLIRKLFPKTKNTKFFYEIKQPEMVFNSDKYIKRIIDDIDGENVTVNDDDLKIAFYLYEIVHDEVLELFVKMYKNNRAPVVKLFDGYFNQQDVAPLFKQNICEIINHILKIDENSELLAIYNKFNQRKDFKQAVLQINKIWE